MKTSIVLKLLPKNNTIVYDSQTIYLYNNMLRISLCMIISVLNYIASLKKTPRSKIYAFKTNLYNTTKTTARHATWPLVRQYEPLVGLKYVQGHG